MHNKNNVKLSNYMENYDLIEVKISPEGEWYNNIVNGINDSEDILEISLIDIFLNMNLMLDDVIYCKLIKEDNVYIFEGNVIDIGIMNSERVLVKIQNVKKYNNERKNRRYTVNLCGSIVFDNHEESTFVTVKDMSVGGISIACKEKIRLYEEIDIDIVLWKDKVLSIEGKIVRVIKIGNIYRYGVVIENIEPKSKELLNMFIDELDELSRKQF